MPDYYEPQKGDICTIGKSDVRWRVHWVGRFHGGTRMISLDRVDPPERNSGRGMNTTVDVRRLNLVAAAPPPPPPRFISHGAYRIVGERQSAAIKHGYTPQHDLEYEPDEGGLSSLTVAALCCLTAALQRAGGHEVQVPAWPPGWAPFKSESIDDDLVRAGAFIAAELDRRHLAEQVGE